MARPGPAPDLAKRARAAALYEELGTVEKVAARLKVSTGRAHTLIREGGGVLARPGRRAKADK